MQIATRPVSNSGEILANLPRIGGVIPMYVDGEWRLAANGATRELYDPANGQPIATIAESTVADVEAAIAAARKAFDEGPWASMNATERAALLFRVADAIDARRDEFSRIDTLNNGKPLRETQYDAADAANCFRYYAGLATKPHGQTFDVPAPSQTFTVREPIGVCGQIVPWNYPLLMATWKLAPALAAGNVCILKPSELTPLSTIALAAIFEELEFPPGVVNVVPGPGATVGHAIAASTLVDKIAFTGGTKTGRSIMQAATSNLKKISLELGGKSPNVVFADADFETAVDYALFGIFANAGQVCSAGSRLVIQRSLRDRFVERLVERAQNIRVGDRSSRRCIANESRRTSQPVSKRERSCSAAESVSAVRLPLETSSHRRSSTVRLRTCGS
jgi:betaine-aldehyde dehydrogenase